MLVEDIKKWANENIRVNQKELFDPYKAGWNDALYRLLEYIEKKS